MLPKILSLWKYDKIRFLVAGSINTTVGYVAFLGMYAWLHSKMHYLVILFLNFILCSFFGFMMLKLVVFRTRGNHHKEYMRCLFVYTGTLIINALLLHLFVSTFSWNVPIAQLVSIAIIALISYCGHKYISFRHHH